MAIVTTLTAFYLRTPYWFMINVKLLAVEAEFIHSHLCNSKYYVLQKLTFRIWIFFLLLSPNWSFQIKQLKFWSSGRCSADADCNRFFYLRNLMCFGNNDNYIKSHILGLSHATYRTFFDCKLRSRGLRNMKFLKLLLKSDSGLFKWSSLMFT